MATYKGKRGQEEHVNPFRVHGNISNEYKHFGVEKDVFFLDQISLDAYGKMKRLFNANNREIMNTIFNDAVEELVDKLRFKGYNTSEIENFFARMDEKTFYDNVVVPMYNKVYSSLTIPFFERSSHTVRDYQSFNLGALSLMQGRGETKDKISYWSWPMREKLVRRDQNLAPYIYFTGKPGWGKSNGLDLQVLQALEINYWAYTNRPILGRDETDNLYRISRLTDLFIDTPEIPSIFRAFMWGRENHIKTGVEIALDERGMGERTASKEGLLKQELMQVRRHFKMSISEGGVRQLQPGLEQDITLLVGCYMTELGEMDKEGHPKKKFTWEIIFRRGEEEEDENGEPVRRYTVHNIPRCTLPRMDENEFDLTPDFEIDIGIKNLLRYIGDPAKQTTETLYQKTRDYARMQRGMMLSTTAFKDIQGSYPIGDDDDGDEDEDNEGDK